jgi:hypothetical protein
VKQTGISQFTYSWISFFFDKHLQLDLNNDHQRSDENECLEKSKAAFPNFTEGSTEAQPRRSQALACS